MERVADGLSDTRSARAKKILPAGALLWAWEANTEFEEVAGQVWLILIPNSNLLISIISRSTMGGAWIQSRSPRIAPPRPRPLLHPLRVRPITQTMRDIEGDAEVDAMNPRPREPVAKNTRRQR